MTTPHLTDPYTKITYQDVTPTIRVEINDDTQSGCILYRLQSLHFGQWYYKHEIMEFYDVPIPNKD